MLVHVAETIMPLYFGDIARNDGIRFIGRNVGKRKGPRNVRFSRF